MTGLPTIDIKLRLEHLSGDAALVYSALGGPIAVAGTSANGFVHAASEAARRGFKVDEPTSVGGLILAAVSV